MVLKATNIYCTDSVLKPVTINHPLEAKFSTSADTICEGSTINFTDASIATVIYGTDPQYYWDFADGNTSTLQNPTHSYTHPGIYNVMMVVENAIPCRDTVYRTIYVDSLPQVSFTRSDTSVCRGQIVEFRGLYTQSGLDNIQWNFGENTDRIDNLNPAHHAFENAGTYTITFYGNYRVCSDVSTTMQLLVKPSPVVNLGPDTTLCLDGPALLLADNINAADPKASWLWSTGATTASILAKHDGIYSATVTIDQCSTTDEVKVVKDCIIDVPQFVYAQRRRGERLLLPTTVSFQWRSCIYNEHLQSLGTKRYLKHRNPTEEDGTEDLTIKMQPVGVYIYSIKVMMKNGRTEEYTGNVTLLQ